MALIMAPGEKWAEKIEVQNVENLVKSGPARSWRLHFKMTTLIFGPMRSQYLRVSQWKVSGDFWSAIWRGFLNGVSMLPVIIEHFNLTPLIFGPMREDLDADWLNPHFWTNESRLWGNSKGEGSKMSGVILKSWAGKNDRWKIPKHRQILHVFSIFSFQTTFGDFAVKISTFAVGNFKSLGSCRHFCRMAPTFC